MELIDLISPMENFSKALGKYSPDWIVRERLDIIDFRSEEFSSEQALSIPFETIQDLQNTFGKALTLKFSLGGAELLTANEEITPKKFSDFRHGVNESKSPFLEVYFRVDKKTLITNYFPECNDNVRPYLYIFQEAFENLICSSNLLQLESLLWQDEPDRKALIILPSMSILINGVYLSIIGKEFLSSLTSLIPDEANLPDKRIDLFDRCQDSVRWQIPFIKYLTPLHFYITPSYVEPKSKIFLALLTHLTNIILLFISERTVSRNKETYSLFIGSQQSLEIKHHPANDNNLKIEIADVVTLFKLFEWTYDKHWKVSDRIPLVQIGFVQSLNASDPGYRFPLLLHNAGSIYEGLQWHWKAFAENKIEEFTQQVQDLEDYVSSTVKSFNDQIVSIVRGLNENMLAAVLALIGSFIAALFSDKFNPLIFRIGLLVYAGYIFLFPLTFNMANQWGQYKAIESDFSARRKRFEDRFYPDKVELIIGDQIKKNVARFKRWFVNTILTYLIVTFIAIAVAIILPEVIIGSNALLTTSTSPLPAITVTYTPIPLQTHTVTSTPTAKITLTPPSKLITTSTIIH